MAEHNPLRINRTGATGKVQEFIPGMDTISGTFLPNGAVWADLLIGGFVILTRTPTQDGATGRRAWVGSISGRPSATYWYDSSVRAWYDDATSTDAANRLIGFGGN